ncbi:hypothetical protein POTOM_036160 [Populus tomentosa]|uniref:Uncharacterized protein n=1 Tax=Populus tomentosa TaxID=118781 RepID=A0A8X7YZP8_POPTO|nr:hypothetical protein POTOM_036160 [Populus tomentosa]
MQPSGHRWTLMKAPAIGFQILLFMRLEGTSPGAEHIPLELVLVDTLPSHQMLKIILDFCTTDPVIIAYVGCWSIDEGSRKEWAKIYCAGGSGYVSKCALVCQRICWSNQSTFGISALYYAMVMNAFICGAIGLEVPIPSSGASSALPFAKVLKALPSYQFRFDQMSTDIRSQALFDHGKLAWPNVSHELPALSYNTFPAEIVKKQPKSELVHEVQTLLPVQ